MSILGNDTNKTTWFGMNPVIFTGGIIVLAGAIYGIVKIVKS